MKLSDIACKTAKPKEKAYKLSDGGGLYLEVTTKGSKLWRLKYRYLGKEKKLCIGEYPIITLADARSIREKSKKLLHDIYCLLRRSREISRQNPNIAL